MEPRPEDPLDIRERLRCAAPRAIRFRIIVVTGEQDPRSQNPTMLPLGRSGRCGYEITVP
jgi:hypothetical protein